MAQRLQDDKLDFKVGTIYTGTYDYVPATALSTVGSNITSGGGETEVWNFPANIVCLLSEVYFTFTLNGPAAASTTNWLYSNQMPFRRIVLSHEGTVLLDLSQASTFSNFVSFTLTPVSQLQNFDKAYGSAAASVGVNEFMRSGISEDYNWPTAVNAGATTALVTGLRGNYSTDFMGELSADTATAASATAYDFPREAGPNLPTDFYNASITNTASPNIRFRVRLGEAFKGTAFGIKKDVYLPGTLRMEITWEGTNRWSFKNNNTTSFEGTSVSDNTWTRGSQQLLVPLQRDPRVLKEIMTAYQSRSLRYVFDTPIMKTVTISGTSQLPLIQIAQGVFTRIKMAIWAVYHPTQTGTTAYNHRMDEDAAIQKVTSFYAQLNDRRITSTSVALSTYDDWVQQKANLAGSVVALSSAVYRRKWVWTETFGLKNAIESINSDEIQGFDNSTSDFSYTVIATTTSRENNWFLAVIGQRFITYDQGGRLVVSV